MTRSPNLTFIRERVELAEKIRERTPGIEGLPQASIDRAVLLAYVDQLEERLGRYGESCPTAYVNPVDGGYAGYQARCHGCGWAGPMRERQDMPDGGKTKQLARDDCKTHDPNYGRAA